MRTLIWHNDHGVAMAFTLPDTAGNGVEAASVPGGPWARPWQELSAKGSDVSWDDYAESLTQQKPYFGWWSVEDAPDGQDVTGVLQAACAHEIASLVDP